VAIIDPSESRPLKGLSGVQLANWAPHNARYQTHSIPAHLVNDLRERFGEPTYVEEDVNSDAEGDRRILRGLLEQIERKGEICRYLVGREPFDLVAVTFFETHSGGHQLLKHAWLGEECTLALDTELSGGVKAIYRAVDQELGRLLEVLSPEPDVFVISNVGLIEDYPNRVLGEAFCRELGYQVPVEIARRPESRLARARRWIPPSVRQRISRHLSRDMRERLLADHFRTGTDWSRTTAFPVPSLYTGFLRVNLRGREPEGIVDPGADYRALLDRLRGDLEQLIDPVSGRPAVRRVDRVTDLFGETPHPALPDLFVEWEPTRYLKRRVVHPRAVLVQEDLDYERGSHHSREGFVAAAGPGVSRLGDRGEIDVLDLAPTFLALMNEAAPADMTGRVLTDWMAKPGSGESPPPRLA
ncbi:MAG TPA: hypothetical protein VEY33_03985, partial [Gemmatimonadota bacterium]|nr:hypothetical protein [Gemmatimonadota bacterium]